MVTRLRIALWNNLPSGGGKRAFHHIATGLMQRGHVLESFCPPSADRTYLPCPDGIREHLIACDSSQPKRQDGILPGRFGWGRKYSALDNHLRRCADAIHAGNFDVCFSGNSIAPAIPPLGQYLEIPSVIYCQEPDRSLHEARLSRHRSGTNLRARISRIAQLFREDWFRKAEQRDLAAFDRILVNSHFSRETLARLYDLPSTVCYLGVDTALFRPTGRRSRERIVGLGSIHRHKDPELAIQAIARIPEPRRPQLVWIGNRVNVEYAGMLGRLARTLGVHFTIHERLSDEDMVAELSQGAMFLYTSHLEPFGLAPLEANACGLPVVAVAEGGVRETIKHGVNGLLTGSRDPDELAGAITVLLDNPALADEYGHNGVELVERHWSWTRCIHQVEALLLELAGHSPTSVPP